ncbi:hotdog family protein [Shewanella surugensis]|uniref:Hotdog family protein n=1 Tax=Shewanella surugensis TaxID=212020 RepID=A0ABT0LA46_9GAMM|nr:hotdog family protein [Shewanella surugensis]MCL1124591.1 hotdog family protein [Shewanella surugensis]
MINMTAIDTHDVADYLPHSAPMIFIDKIIAYQTDTLLSEINITSQSPYFDDIISGVPNYVGIEYMAQTIAALAGIEALKRNDIIRIGFLLGSRKLQLHVPHYKLGHTYHTRVSRLYQEETGLAVFECQILEQDDIIAQANINVFQPQDTHTYISNSTQDSQEIVK